MQEPDQRWRALLAKARCFAPLPPATLDAMLASMHERTFAVGQKLIGQDGPGSCLLVLTEGTAQVAVGNPSGERRVLGQVGSGDVVGEMALVTGERRSADVVAQEPVRALALPADDFHALARRHPELGVVLTSLIADRLGSADWDALGGKQLGGYRILRSVGRGGTAVVYEAVTADGRRVALKMMSHRLVYDPAALHRFRREADLTETLEHENIARLLGRFSAFGTHFLVMEFCDGPGLSAVLNRRKPLPDEVVRAIVGQLARALEYVHGRGFLHRDVKAGNVMLMRNGVVKLMDFGLVRPTLRLGDSTETHELSLVGTPSYMAPEQFGAETLDHRVDIYALACLAYKLAAAERPFEKKDVAGLLREKDRFHLPPREQIGLGVGAELYEFLDRGLRPDRDDRLDSLETCARWAAPVDVGALAPAPSGS